jgi:deazaflavin-dependent oxidoreductase (nitroreductase family)
MGWLAHRHHQKPGEASGQQARGMTSMATIGHALVVIISRIIRLLLRADVPVTILGNPIFLLTVRGRTTGQPRSFPVDLYEHNGRRFLVASHGEGDWVRNLRAAGEGTLRRGRRQQAFTAVELTPAAAGLVLKEVLGARLASPNGFVLRQGLGVAPDATLDDFVNAAQRCPVFELGAPRELSASE